MRTSKENRILLDTTLGNYLKEIRLKKDHSRKQVADMLNVSVTMVGLIENGERMPTVETLIVYSLNYPVSIGSLMEQRIITVKKTVEVYGENTPFHIMNEHYLISYFNSTERKELS